MPTPVISRAQMREWEEATWASGKTESMVIARVGELVAQRVLALTQSSQRILLLAGRGHNGDDIRAALPHLTARSVDLLNVQEPAADLPKLEAWLAKRPALIVDGLFGIGLNRPLDAGWCAFIQRVNESFVPVLAVDVPSGLDADTGEPQGAAVRASVTLTLGAPKPGLLRTAAAEFTGRVEVAPEIGLAPCPHTGGLSWTLPEDFAGFPPPRTAASHKGTFGHLAVVAGSLGFHGAAVLATRAAQRAQPGLVTTLTAETAYHPVAAQLQAALVRAWTADVKLPASFSAFLFGPGLAAADVPPEMKQNLRRLWRDVPEPVIVDASALDWLALDPAPKGAVRVITPHPGEAARLLKANIAYVQADRPRAVREISERFGHCWVVLKGHQTLVGRSTGEISVNSSGNPQLAQGGSGDVLAGYLAGLLAQPALQADAPKTIRYAVWQHGATADALQAHQPNWIIEDLVNHVGNERPEDAG
jgi:ADP-dependent NAD(P)H-hydrate dehydratase / NAD(P)H-hydrate epimerase